MGWRGLWGAARRIFGPRTLRTRAALRHLGCRPWLPRHRLALAGRWQWSLSTIVGSTLPSVVGALAVLLGGERGLALLIAGFGLFWLFEHRTHAEHLPGDYLALRRALTLGVCTLLVLVAFASAEATAGSIQ
ncbi:MAG: DUF3429 family protein [Gammaproteobacteria bacterium]|nr:DUF3429 family protein [Gammaproteobacteria bacterium]